MAYAKPRKGDVNVSGPLSESEAKELLLSLSEIVTRMGHGATMHYYIAKCGTSAAVYRCTGGTDHE